MRVLILLIALCGCAPKTPPALWASELQPMVGPELKELKGPRPEDAPAFVAVNPGDAPAYTVDGVSTHRYQAVPPSRVTHFKQESYLADYWEGRANTCHEERLLDRAHATSAYGWCDESARYLRREALIQRTAVVVGTGGALLLGLLIGFQAGAISERISP